MATWRTIDEPTLRFLERHETHAHALPVRMVRDLGDGWLLTDPRDPDPFWNRLVGLRWPEAASAFEHRLAEALALFGLIDRRPHIRPSPAWNRPSDLVARLLDHGFNDTGREHLMVRHAAGPIGRPMRPGRSVGIEVVHRPSPAKASETASAAAHVLGDAFAVVPSGVATVAFDLERSLRDGRVAVVFATVDGEPAAIARSTTFDGATYLSSIGTRPRFQGRGLGTLVTSTAMAHGVAHGGRVQYLTVGARNERALRLYGGLGFVSVGETPDLVLWA